MDKIKEMLGKVKDFFTLSEGPGTAFYYGSIIYGAMAYFMPAPPAALLCFLIFFVREAWRFKTTKKVSYKTMILGILPAFFCALEPYMLPYVGDAWSFIKDFIVGLF